MLLWLLWLVLLFWHIWVLWPRPLLLLLLLLLLLRLLWLWGRLHSIVVEAIVRLTAGVAGGGLVTAWGTRPLWLRLLLVRHKALLVLLK